MAVHVRFESWYISLPSSAKQQREMTKFHVFWRTRTGRCMLTLSKFFRPISVVNTAVNTFTELRHSKVKYKFALSLYRKTEELFPFLM